MTRSKAVLLAMAVSVVVTGCSKLVGKKPERADSHNGRYSWARYANENELASGSVVGAYTAEFGFVERHCVIILSDDGTYRVIVSTPSGHYDYAGPRQWELISGTQSHIRFSEFPRGIEWNHADFNAKGMGISAGWIGFNEAGDVTLGFGDPDAFYCFPRVKEYPPPSLTSQPATSPEILPSADDGSTTAAAEAEI